MKLTITKKSAFLFIVLLGVVSLFADMTYEGARSITGQYLAILGASGLVVGVVAGLGELIGYGLRLVSGYITDKTKRYWLITFVGYTCNLLAVPLLAFAGNWLVASILILLERLGKAIRTPSKDAMLSYATKEVGRGWGFGLHEAMDQTGAIIGPLLVSLTLYYQGSYQFSFALLIVPAICALSVLTWARFLYPRPQDLEVEYEVKKEQFSKKFWLYIAAISCVAAGYVDFPLIAFHFKKTALVSDTWIPIMFSISMAAAGISALVFGWLYDRFGLSILIFVTAIAAFFVPLVFIDGFYFVLFGLILWGIGLGAQESIMRAFIANLVSKDKRGTAYGILNIWFGIFWFLGSALMGFLYDVSVNYLIIFSFAIQLVSLPVLFIVKKLK